MKLILDRIPTLAALAVCSLSLLPGAAAVSAQGDTAFDAPGNLNPIIPGYFADPTIEKFGDTFYLYATTDGNGGGRGPATVWRRRQAVAGHARLAGGAEGHGGPASASRPLSRQLRQRPQPHHVQRFPAGHPEVKRIHRPKLPKCREAQRSSQS
jgi:hypothetical protein